ncbi:MAG: YgjP-like metallopeptidase domain-containing protein [Nitrospirota bacterium]
MAPHNIPYDVSYRNIKYPRLEFKTGKLLFILPFGYKPDYLLDKHRKWILKKSEFIKKCLKESPDKKLVRRTDKEFKELVHSFVKKSSKKIGMELNTIYFRNMKTKWASCSPKRNLTINMLMKYLPDKLIEYVLFHEMVHMIEKRHNDNFWKMVTKKFKDYQKLEKDLFIYWFQLAKKL